MPASAADQRGYVTWKLPTMRENRNPLSRSEINHINVYYAGDDGTNATARLQGAVTSFYTAPCAKGAYAVTAVDQDGRESALSQSTYINKAWLCAQH
jgi:fibronectin type 3 domain-containing protein